MQDYATKNKKKSLFQGIAGNIELNICNSIVFLCFTSIFQVLLLIYVQRELSYQMLLFLL